MSAPIISVENLGKRYTIRHQAGRPAGGYRRLSEELLDAARASFRSLARWRGASTVSQSGDRQSTEDFWALRDITFEVKEGEVLGIIGRNGAGKSTLLKILSRITEPSEGRVRIRGRVASLLEVGTGFHPELSGRENIYLNGAILGMGRAEIRRKFDEIVAFAEVERFLDTPVKRYSSGMYVRLAFSVAAHLDPEILVVDEVLAVGDAEFQRKCLGRMSAIGRTGRTVLFVSHNMAAVRALCGTALALGSGRVISSGDVEAVVTFYHRKSAQVADAAYQAALPNRGRPGIRSIRLSQPGSQERVFAVDRPLDIIVEVECEGIRDAACSIVIRNMHGTWVQHSSDEFNEDFESYARLTRRRCTVPPYALNSGSHLLTVSLGSRSLGVLFEKLEDAVAFDIAFTGPMAERTRPGDWRGACGPGLVQWT